MKEAVPKETETIAARRSARLADKIRRARERLGTSKAWWSNPQFEFFGLLIIFFLNLYLVLSLAGSHAAGTSYSGPFLPFSASILEIFGVPAAFALQVVNVFFFLIFPFSLYLFVRRVAERKMVAFFAALLASIPFSPFGGERFISAFFGIEAPHMACLAVIPFALYGLLSFLREGKINNLVIAAISGAWVALISPFGFFTYLIFSVIVVFSEFLLGQGKLKIARFLLVLLFTGGLCSFWYDPVFFSYMVFGSLGGEIRTTISRLLPISFFLLPVLATFGYLLFDRKPDLQALFLALFFSIAFATIYFSAMGKFPSHPARYLSELGVSLAILVGVVTVKAFERIRDHGLPRVPIALTRIGSRVILLFIFAILCASIIFGRKTVLARARVLGIWQESEREGVWLARDEFFNRWGFIGKIITGASVGSLGFLSIRRKNLERS